MPTAPGVVEVSGGAGVEDGAGVASVGVGGAGVGEPVAGVLGLCLGLGEVDVGRRVGDGDGFRVAVRVGLGLGLAEREGSGLTVRAGTTTAGDVGTSSGRTNR